MTLSSNPADFAIKLHLRTISTNAPHPLAKQAGFSVPISWIHSNCFIQIVDDVVGMFCWVHGPALFIWNWHHAELLIVSFLPVFRIIYTCLYSPEPRRAPASA